MSPIFLKEIKKKLVKYFTPTDWPWEIISGLFIVLLLINEAKFLLQEWTINNVAKLSLIILLITLFWAVIEGLIFIFTALLEKGRYNRMVLRVKSVDKKLALEIITNELDRTMIEMVNEKTKTKVAEEILKNVYFISDLKKPKISADDIKGAILCIFFVLLPCIVILPFFLLINNLKWSILISNLLGMAILFAFGYKWASCTDRNKILSGLTIMAIGLAIIFLAYLLGA